MLIHAVVYNALIDKIVDVDVDGDVFRCQPIKLTTLIQCENYLLYVTIEMNIMTIENHL